MNEFDKIAFIYDRLAKLIFGESIINAQKHFLSKIPDRAKILILGGGSGWILTELAMVKPDIEIRYVESSSKMIALSKERMTKKSVQFIHGTENNIPENGEYDIVITNFYLDLFTDSSLKTVLLKLKKSLKQGGLWIATDFVENNWWQSMMLKVMYLFFKMTSKIQSKKLPQWNNALMELGGRKTGSKFYYQGFIEATLFQF